MTWHKIYRENGLVELACEHGVGHPSLLLTPERYYYGVHGCCGCCFKHSAEFALVEQAMAGTRFTMCNSDGELT